MGQEPAIERERLDAGRTLLQNGKIPEATAVFQEITARMPDSAEAWHFLGVSHALAQRWAEAESCLRQAIARQSRSAHTYFNLGNILLQRGATQESIEHLNTAVALEPATAKFHAALGDAHAMSFDFDSAAISYRKAFHLEPSPEMEFKLGKNSWEQGDFDKAIEHLQNTVRQEPGNASCHRYLGLAYGMSGRLREAVRSLEEALKLAPQESLIHSDLAIYLRDQGRLREAEESQRRAVALGSSLTIPHSNLLLLLNYTSHDPATLYAEHRKWVETHVPRERPTHGWKNNCDPLRRLKIGYVSPDFRRHSVAFFLGPILASHDAERVEVYCYANVRRPDTTTAHFKDLAHEWRDIHGKTDTQAAEQIQKDEIDILVDLAGHTGENRLLLFALKPAPVQVSYLGYPNTTGLSEMDYRLTDTEADPPGQERFHSERLFRLPGGFLCFGPPHPSPPISPTPAKNTGMVTFGSFNMLPKISTETLHAWDTLLHTVPDSRLLLKNISLQDADTAELLLARFESAGIPRSRIEIVPATLSTGDHLALYNSIDIALDTFPYNGTTTTCEALWMGVPVVTLAGNRHAGRVGVSLLERVGLPELIATNPEDYVRIASTLARDSGQLETLRLGLRERMATSPLCDAKRFTRELEDAYRAMWREWCAGQ